MDRGVLLFRTSIHARASTLKVSFSSRPAPTKRTKGTLGESQVGKRSRLIAGDDRAAAGIQFRDTLAGPSPVFPADRWIVGVSPVQKLGTWRIWGKLKRPGTHRHTSVSLTDEAKQLRWRKQWLDSYV